MTAKPKHQLDFLAHRLLASDPSTPLNGARMEELGVTEPQAGEFPRSFEWFNCPVRGPNGAEIRLSFRLLPILADRFLALMQSDKVNKTKLAAEWVEAEFVASVEAAITGGYDLTFGAGALTKDPIKHGQGLIDKYPDLAARVAITDGNAGTATLIQEQVLRAGFQPGDTVAVFGPTGGLGCGVAQLLLDLQPESLLLIGHKDEEGSTRNRDRLDEVAKELRGFKTGTKIITSQDKSQALHDHPAQFAVLATIVMRLSREEVPCGTVVVDATTPSSCEQNPLPRDGRLVVSGGCGVLPKWSLPEGVGKLFGRRQHHIGAGGFGVFWGCSLQAMAMALKPDDTKRHRVGPAFDSEDARWCRKTFKEMGVLPQPWWYLGQSISDDEVCQLVHDRRRRL